MTHDFVTRRAASMGILLAIVSISRSANSQLDGDPVLAVGNQLNASVDPSLKWGEDGTRSSLAESLTSFFGNATGPYMDLSKEHSGAQIQNNGEYLLSDQFKLPLMGVAMQRIDRPSGHHIYPAFINHNPITRVFLLTDDQGSILSVAYADNMIVRKNGEVAGVVPRLTVFFKTAEPPAELQDVAVEQMQNYYKAFGADTSRLGYDIHVYAQRLPSLSGSQNQ